MTRKKKLILLLALTVAFAAVFVLVAVFVPDNDATDENLVISDYDTVTAISWKSDKGSFEIRKNEDEKWYCTDNEDFPLSEDTALEMASAVKNITAIKLISENAENLSVYGLDNPSLTITAVYGDVTKEYKIGDYNEASGYNYFMHNGSQALYYVDSTFSSLFTKRLSDLAEYEYIQTIEAENVTDISLKSGEKEINITRYPEGTEGFDEEFIYFTQDMAPCDTEITESLIEGFVNVPWISCEAYSPDSQQLEDFGLSSPAAEFTISFTYSESEEETGNENMLNDTQTLLIGSTTGENDEYRYAMIKGGKCVYTLPEDTAEQYIISTGTELFPES